MVTHDISMRRVLYDFLTSDGRPTSVWDDYLITLGITCDTNCASVTEELLPLQWMAECYRLVTDEARTFGTPIRFYTSDRMMWLYERERDNDLFEEDVDNLVAIDNAIMSGPRPDKGFTVFRGIMHNPQSNVGDIVAYTTPKSGSFNHQVVAEMYINTEVSPGLYGYLVEIEVPPDLPCFYAKSEQQVIFPEGSRFEVLESEHVRQRSVFGKQEFVVAYKWRYLGI